MCKYYTNQHWIIYFHLCFAKMLLLVLFSSFFFIVVFPYSYSHTQSLQVELFIKKPGKWNCTSVKLSICLLFNGGHCCWSPVVYRLFWLMPWCDPGCIFELTWMHFGVHVLVDALRRPRMWTNIHSRSYDRASGPLVKTMKAVHAVYPSVICGCGRCSPLVISLRLVEHGS
jgi:hypothetical protein